MAGKLTYPVNDENMKSGTIENISLGGLLMTSPAQYDKGTIIQVKIALPGWHKNHPGFIKVMENSIGSPFTAVCEVLRTQKKADKYQIAVKYINIDPDDFIAYEGYLHKEFSN